MSKQKRFTPASARRVLQLFLVLLFGLSMLLPAFECEASASDQAEAYQTMLVDDAGLLTGDEKQEVLAAMEPVTEYATAVFVSATACSGTQEQFCDSFYNQYIGSGNAVVLFIDMENRVIRLQAFGDACDVITDDYGDTITDNIYTFASDEDYAGCACEAFQEVLSLLAGERIAQPMKYITNALLALLLAAVLTFLLVLRMIRKKAPSQEELAEHLDYYIHIENHRKVLRSREKVADSSGGSGYSSSGGSSRSFHSSSGHSSSHSGGHSSSRSSGGQHKF